MADKNKRLGIGLSELLGENQNISDAVDEKFVHIIDETFSQNKLKFIPIDMLMPCVSQPRKIFNVEYLDELTQSIKEKGVLQPILVRWLEEKNIYEIIAGERRWRACQKAGIHEVPAIISMASDKEVLENSIIENIQRQDLNPVEIGQALKTLMEEFSYTHEKISEVIGKSRSHVTNLLRLCTASQDIVQALLEEKISFGHAKILVNLDDPRELLESVVKKDLSVRGLEELIKKDLNKDISFKNNSHKKDQDTIVLENDLTNALGIRVKINHKGDKTGTICLNYQSIEQLDEICRRLCNDIQTNEI